MRTGPCLFLSYRVVQVSRRFRDLMHLFHTAARQVNSKDEAVATEQQAATDKELEWTGMDQFWTAQTRLIWTHLKRMTTCLSRTALLRRDAEFVFQVFHVKILVMSGHSQYLDRMVISGIYYIYVDVYIYMYVRIKTSDAMGSFYVWQW